MVTLVNGVVSTLAAIDIKSYRSHLINVGRQIIFSTMFFPRGPARCFQFHAPGTLHVIEHQSCAAVPSNSVVILRQAAHHSVVARYINQNANRDMKAATRDCLCTTAECYSSEFNANVANPSSTGAQNRRAAMVPKLPASEFTTIALQRQVRLIS